MRSRKDSTKLNSILVLVDLLLVAVIAVMGFLCWTMMEEAKKAPTLDFAHESALLQQQEEKLDAEIAAQQELLRADLTSETFLKESQSIQLEMEQVKQGIDRKSVRVGKECRSRWSPYH